jgi:general stress protein 26
MASDNQDRVWDILKKTSIGMLTTRFTGGLRARPLDARPDREAGIIYFLTDVRGLKDDEIATNPEVCFTVTNASHKVYLSITGAAEVRTDPERAAKIWKKTDDVWWPQRENDPNVRVLRLDPATAELWDGPKNTVVAAYEFAKARPTGEKPDLGENRKSSVDMSI